MKWLIKCRNCCFLCGVKEYLLFCYLSRLCFFLLWSLAAVFHRLNDNEHLADSLARISITWTNEFNFVYVESPDCNICNQVRNFELCCFVLYFLSQSLTMIIYGCFLSDNGKWLKWIRYVHIRSCVGIWFSIITHSWKIGNLVYHMCAPNYLAYIISNCN